ncbi:MAG TPA: YbdK family carboxylate-amine ligase [Rubrobacteraceae bacterium]|nr:YbdK family carboxylate-amine ligase [Rubrobacteraceae bacterium]
MTSADNQSLIAPDAFETGGPEGTLGAEEELWLADPETFKLANGAQKILAATASGEFSGELIDCEIEANTGVHADPAGVVSDLISRRRVLLERADSLGRLLGTSGTHPIGDWREQEIIDKPHYQRLKRKLGWLIRRNNTFSLHVHYAVQGREKALYVFNRVREYLPHMLALSVNSPFWQGEYTDMHSARVLMFSRTYHRAGLPEPLGSWSDYTDYVDYLKRSGLIDTLGEIWWDVRLHPGLDTVEIRAFDAQTDVSRNEALIAFAAAVCDMLVSEYESGDLKPFISNREIEENKWSAQRNGLDGEFIDHTTHEPVPTRSAIETLIDNAVERSDRDLSTLATLLTQPTESARQLAVWRETGSILEVARDVAQRTRSATEAKI